MTDQPLIILGDQQGAHNADLQRSVARLSKAKTYKDLSTVCIIPTRGMIPARVVERWMGLMTPMNQPFLRIIVEKMEVAAAYNAGIETILNSELRNWKYVLTLEEDNMPPPDGLLRLYEHIDEYAAVGGLYWTKGEEGQPMIYGDPHGIVNFVPQLPVPDSVQECNGLGMGFTLFNMSCFTDRDGPWFKTLEEFEPGVGVRAATQDLYFFGQLRKEGLKVACDTRVRVGHFDHRTGIVW